MADLLTMLLAVLALLGVLYLMAGPAMRLAKHYTDRVVTVMDGEAGLRFVKGELAGVVGPGRYRTWPEPVTLERVDLREQSLSLSGQELVTKDALTIKVSAVLRYKITSPLLWRRAASSMLARMYEDAQLQLRARVAAATLDELLADRERAVAGVVEELNASLAEKGGLVTAMFVRDLTLSGPAKTALADLWRAQKEGQAALERARGEQASLRALANAARMLKNNPELMNLRLLQTVSAAGPARTAPTLVLGGGAGFVPLREAPAAAPPPPPEEA